jgi:hypothetical protein
VRLTVRWPKGHLDSRHPAQQHCPDDAENAESVFSNRGGYRNRFIAVFCYVYVINVSRDRRSSDPRGNA